MRKASGLVIARRPQADVAISQYPTRSQESHRRKRSCLPEIAPQGHFLALRAQGATAPSGPRNDKSGSIAPLNSCHQYCQPAWRSLSAATDAIGRCVFIDTLHELEVPSRDCHVALLFAMTRQGGVRCTSALVRLNIPVQGAQ